MHKHTYQGCTVLFGLGAGAMFFLEPVLQSLYGDKPVMARSMVANGEWVRFIAMMGLVMGGLLAVPFAVWWRFRERRLKAVFKAPWLMAILCGLVYPLALYLSFSLVAFDGRVTILDGTFMYAALFGLPVLFAELCVRYSLYVDPW